MRFRVGTFNAYNLSLPNVDYYPGRRYSEATYRRKLAWIGAQLDAMRAEIVGFQEVFQLEALEQALAARTSSPGGEQVLFAPSSDGRLGPRNALVSSFPVASSEVIEDFPDELSFDVGGARLELSSFQRPLIKAQLDVGGRDLIVFVAHLKSKRPKFLDGEDEEDPGLEALATARSLLIRTAEATALRWILIETMRDNRTPVVVLGDMNDANRAVSTEIIKGAPPWIGHPLARKKRIWDALLYSTYTFQAQRSDRDVYYTHLYNGHHETLDHVLVSQELVRQNPQRIGHVEALRVYNDHLADRTVSPDSVPKWASDHGQVVVSLRLTDTAQDAVVAGANVAVDPDSNRLIF